MLGKHSGLIYGSLLALHFLYFCVKCAETPHVWLCALKILSWLKDNLVKAATRGKRDLNSSGVEHLTKMLVRIAQHCGRKRASRIQAGLGNIIMYSVVKFGWRNEMLTVGPFPARDYDSNAGRWRGEKVEAIVTSVCGGGGEKQLQSMGGVSNTPKARYP